MDNLEKVEKIREKTGASYEDAKKALDACDYDILDAIVYLEKLGKVSNQTVVSYTTSPKEESPEFDKAQQNYEKSCKTTSAGEVLNKILKWCGKAIKKCCDTSFQVKQHGEPVGTVPVLVLILLLILAFWVTIPLLIIGLFFEFSYSFVGVDPINVDLNKACDKASEMCAEVKKDITNK